MKFFLKKLKKKEDKRNKYIMKKKNIYIYIYMWGEFCRFEEF